MLDKEFVSKVESSIKFEEEMRDDDLELVTEDFINDEISESKWDLETELIWKRFNAAMWILCGRCVSRGASNEELARLFGEDYNQYL